MSDNQVRDLLIRDLKERKHRLDMAKLEYETSLWLARSYRVPNTVIARAVGLSEAAVRMFFVRRAS